MFAPEEFLLSEKMHKMNLSLPFLFSYEDDINYFCEKMNIFIIRWEHERDHFSGGTGSRLAPLTKVFCKQLLPIYDKPLVYYPLSVLMLAGIKDILIITTPKDESAFKSLFGDGSHLVLSISYEAQPEPKGSQKHLLLVKIYLLIKITSVYLGDNIFYGEDFLLI